MADGHRARFQRLREAPEPGGGAPALRWGLPGLGERSRPAQPQRVCTEGGGRLSAGPCALRTRGRVRGRGQQSGPSSRRCLGGGEAGADGVGSGREPPAGGGPGKAESGQDAQPSPAGALSPHPALATARKALPCPSFSRSSGISVALPFTLGRTSRAKVPAVPQLCHVRQAPACGQPAALGRWLPPVPFTLALRPPSAGSVCCCLNSSSSSLVPFL